MKTTQLTFVRDSERCVVTFIDDRMTALSITAQGGAGFGWNSARMRQWMVNMGWKVQEDDGLGPVAGGA